LDLGFNGIGDKGCDALALAAVAGNYTLQSVYLSGNNIRERGALSLAGAIVHGTGVTSLYLSANSIGSAGMATIAAAVAQNDERLSSPEAHIVSSEAPSRRMEHLHISATDIDHDGFESITRLVLSTASLKTLCISDNNIDDHDMVLLSQALAQNKSIPIEAIRLGYNQITCHGVECFMNAIWGCPTLKEIMLNHNKIQDRGAQLCAVVLTSIGLHTLDLSFNRVTTVGIKALMKNLSENNSLQSLSLCGIPIDLNASKAVSYALAYNTSLRELYLDNCSTGYSTQRHIVAGVVSNRRSSLCVLTGFAVGRKYRKCQRVFITIPVLLNQYLISATEIAMTLGMPNLPVHWTNAQVLGFFQGMWTQWLFKSGRGTTPTDDQSVRGPAPPAAVAAAAKIALAALGASHDVVFPRAERGKLMTERPPIDPARSSLMEKTESGVLTIPAFANDLNGNIDEWLDKEWQKDLCAQSLSSSSEVRSPLENPEQRNRNLQWLRGHFRSLNEVGRLPFNNADLWQLHQYYFSPPFSPNADLVKVSSDSADGHGSEEGHANSDNHEEDSSPARTMNSKGLRLGMGRTLSFQTLGNAFAASGVLPQNMHKRPPEAEADDDNCPAAKRAKSLSKPRIGYYPRIMVRNQLRWIALTVLCLTHSSHTRSLLRRLRYSHSEISQWNSRCLSFGS
jgi:Ran GTPase-activating protein (RanGAP) involved in mRNA processing and transport